jgi:antitoxin component of RelBE/YafQ-DinJ toxin-antitoxin module
VKIDKAVKDSAQEVARSAGLTLSALVSAYLRQIVAMRRIEFYAAKTYDAKI